jgi:choline dehydrogenase-like flavoprotein
VIVDAAGPERTAFAEGFDVCVIGAGPAGITLARRLAAAGAAVALMEAGGLEISAESQDAYAGRNVGLDYYDLDVARLRYFGGTSNHWGGMCRNLDPDDFTPHPWHPLSGWPISKTDLDPYRAETRDILELSHPVAKRKGDPTQAPDPAGARLLDFPDEDFGQATPRLRHVSFRYSPPVRFGEKYRAEIAASGRLRLGLNANLVDLRLDEDHGAVTAAVFRSYDPADPGFTVAARFYALCAGGIENPRILLNARS